MAEGTELKRTDDDMIIIIAQEIRKLGETPTIDMAQMDEDLDLAAGSTARLIESAAQDANYVVIRKGSTHASLAVRRIGRLRRA
jgi:hypothetical protein